MDERPQDELPENRQKSPDETGFFHRLSVGVARLGVGETALRFGTNFLSFLLIVGVLWLMQFLYARGVETDETSQAAGGGELPASQASLLPVAVSASLEGISRQAILNTIIPTRPRIDVITYTVEVGDTIFAIAEKYNLKPTTILFANQATLADNPNLIAAGQELNILPVDGTYHQWLGGSAETLTGIAKYFGVEPEVIIEFPGNHLDPDMIGDYENPNIADGTWLIIPGGTRAFTSWTAPAQLVRDNPSVRVWGQGVCSGISYVQVGYGTFVYPTPAQWLSGTDYRPDVNHLGVDFAGSMGSGIFAVDAGTVVYSGWNDWGYGYVVVIDHGNGWQTLYAHLSSINVGCGQAVFQGGTIAGMGCTGNCSGPHVHFEMMSDAYGKVNPVNFLP